MNAAEILKWAVNPHAPPPPSGPAQADEENLLQLVAHHRLSGRLLARVRRERPSWCSRTLLFSLWKQQEMVKQQWRAQVTAANELSAAFSTPNEPLIFIKGFSPHALTGDENAIRFSGDLDLFFPDLERLQRTLREKGHPEGEPAFTHEFATLFYNGQMLELHRYFPVWSYPPEMTAAAVLPEKNPDWWVQPFSHQSLREIRYEDLRENAVRGVTPETANLFVPSAALTVLILCAHEFKEFIESPFTLRTIKLAAVAEAWELARHPQFDATRFLDLVDQFAGHDAAAFLGYLMEAYCGSNPLPQAAFSPRFNRQTGFPQGLNFFGGWAVLHRPDDLLLPIAMGQVITALGPNQIVAAAAEPPEAEAPPAVAHENAQTIRRALVQTADRCAQIPLQIAVTGSADRLFLDVFLARPLSDDASSYFVQVCFFDKEIIFHVVEIHHQGAEREQGGAAETNFAFWENGYRLRFSFAWDALPKPPREGAAPLPALLFVSHWRDRDDPLFKKANPVVVVPLHVVRA